MKWHGGVKRNRSGAFSVSFCARKPQRNEIGRASPADRLRRSARFEITPVQYGLLITLSLNPDLDQSSLGRELGIDRANVADVLNRLARRHLLKRCRSPDDRRMVLARLTPAGEKLTKKIYRSMDRAQERLLKPLLPHERQAFIITLVRLINGNNQSHRPTKPTV
jgi:DNA-binding MarR family transcriptional regulator